MFTVTRRCCDGVVTVMRVDRARSGVVNVYDSTCLTEHRPTPLKALMNLTTPCSSLVFNSSTEMLAIASDQAIAGARLVSERVTRVNYYYY